MMSALHQYHLLLMATGPLPYEDSHFHVLSTSAVVGNYWALGGPDADQLSSQKPGASRYYQSELYAILHFPPPLRICLHIPSYIKLSWLGVQIRK
jgi:hypothetical protein